MLFEDRPSGPLFRAAQVGRLLSAHGVESRLVFPKGQAMPMASDFPEIRWQRLDTHRLPRLAHPSDVAAWSLHAARDILEFRRYFKCEGIEVVHVNGAPYLPPAIAARLAGVPLVWHLNDTVLPRAIARLLGRFVVAVADVVVVAAEAVGRHYGIPEDVGVVVHAPVDVSRFPLVPRSPRRQHDPFRVGLFANWNPIKDHATFLHAIAEVRKTGLDIRVVLAGARLDSHREYAKAIDQTIIDLGLTDVVEQPGFVVDVPATMATLDAVAMSSRSEASPLSVLEAMASGLPVVATDVGGVREMLCRPDETAGIVVGVESSAAMASAFRQLMMEVGLADRMGAAGRRVAQQFFGLPRCVDQHLTLYHRAVATRENGRGRPNGMSYAE